MDNIEISKIAKENGFEPVDTVLDSNNKILFHYKNDQFHLYVGKDDGIAIIEQEVILTTHNFSFSSEALKSNFEKFEDGVKSLFKQDGE